MPNVSRSDVELIEHLHSLVFKDSDTRNLIYNGFKEALALFETPDYSLPFSSYNIPITHFSDRIPEALQGMVGLCRVFVLRAGCKMPRPEIHRNSIQRLVSFKGKGAIFSALPGGVDMTFTGYEIVSPNAELSSTELSSPMEESWDIVPENTWHFPVAGQDEDWFTVTFHSATEAEIIDEYAEVNV